MFDQINSLELIAELIRRGDVRKIRVGLKGDYELKHKHSDFQFRDYEVLILNKEEDEMEGNISIKDAAVRMGKTQQFIRIGLQRNLLPFGRAIKMNKSYSYHISPKLFAEYMGDVEEKK